MMLSLVILFVNFLCVTPMAEWLSYRNHTYGLFKLLELVNGPYCFHLLIPSVRGAVLCGFGPNCTTYEV